MGLIIIIVWLGALGLLSLPALGLGPPAIPGVALWIATRAVRRSSVAGAAAGFFLSIPTGIALAAPVMLTIPSPLGLRFEP